VRAHLCKDPLPERGRPPLVWGQGEAEGELSRADEAAPFLTFLLALRMAYSPHEPTACTHPV
jgi:hypothetical protein